MADIATSAPADSGETRRDFLYLAATGMGVVGAACVAWPLNDTMNPSAEVLALASTEVDLAPIAEIQRVTVTRRGNQVFIDHRTQQQIKQAEAVDVEALPEPQPDSARVQKPEWLIVRSEEHTSELQSLMRNSYAVFCLKK